ncbi:Alpha/Beta hydrolase protein [Gymnopilus junonius]|uniref:Alpha/Beta hydrolase protein n=1 Tax=Gymnopilus junonius TaxID=109634 RepID=A0A9P5NLF2_GYMJU|nr:Alpha/Beta hydrolase protein [Gymnopilus junonius]
MSLVKKGKYGEVSYWDIFHIFTVWIRLPLALTWTATWSILFHRNNFRKATAIHVFRWFSKKYTVPQMQYLLPKTVDTYKTWAKANNLPITVEDLVDDAMIMWIGPKRRDKVVLYLPGGGYVAPLLDYPLSFWLYVQKELLKNDCDVGFVVLAYSLVPDAEFPTQLRQATVAVEHLVALGVHPSNLHLVGDSAGGNLILSLLSHILHPLDSIRPIMPLPAPIRGAYLMSPWVRMNIDAASFRTNAAHDVFLTPNAEHYADRFLASVKEDQRPYAEPGAAPDSWFDGLDTVVERVLMTAGGKEILRDDIIHFSHRLGKTSSDVTFVVQDDGVHIDPMLDFLVKLPHDQLGSLTPQIVDWLVEGFSSST